MNAVVTKPPGVPPQAWASVAPFRSTWIAISYYTLHTVIKKNASFGFCWVGFWTDSHYISVGEGFDLTNNFLEAVKILKDFLASPERSQDCFDIHQMQGAMAAILSCPEVVDEVDLGFLILGEDERHIEQWFEGETIRPAWITCLNTIGEDLGLDRFSLVGQYIDEAPSIAPCEAFRHWCDGYLRGYLLTEEAWGEAYAFLAEMGLEEYEDDHLAFLSMLAAIADWEQALQDNDDPERLKQSFPLLAQTIDESVLRINHLALTLEDIRVAAETKNLPLVNEFRNVGRNDPCPCGSGKKYKNCCLH